jgi:hypothetical protein
VHHLVQQDLQVPSDPGRVGVELPPPISILKEGAEATLRVKKADL